MAMLSFAIAELRISTEKLQGHNFALKLTACTYFTSIGKASEQVSRMHLHEDRINSLQNGHSRQRHPFYNH